MEAYTVPYEVRWTDIDANRHVRYSAYIDAAAEMRFRFFSEHTLTPDAFEKLGIGPVYTNITVNFFREVLFGDTLTISFLLAGLSPQGMRWKVRHDFFKANGKKAVTLLIEGTMLDLSTRKPTLCTPEIMAVFQYLPHTADFETLSDIRWFGKP